MLAYNDTTPEWTIIERLTEMIKAALGAAASGCTIVFFHFAGHNNYSVNDKLLLFAAALSSKLIKADALLNIIDPCYSVVLDDNSPVDIVFVLNCYYSFLMAKTAIPIG
jgi:hypothetical protein